jgi:hypothetical protein
MFVSSRNSTVPFALLALMFAALIFAVSGGRLLLLPLYLLLPLGGLLGHRRDNRRF